MNRAFINVSLLLGILPFLGISGCSIFHQAETPSQARVENVYRSPAWEKASFRRVALLPLTTDPALVLSANTVESLSPALHSELTRIKQFEVVGVPAQRLQELTGRFDWKTEEKLPAGFFDILKEEFGCDAVLFGKITHYRAYPPLAVGWQLKLVDATSAEILWAVDENFDASNQEVAALATRYQAAQIPAQPALRDSLSVLQSPTRFGRFTAQAVLNALKSH